jgi:hypothetical protein
MSDDLNSALLVDYESSRAESASDLNLVAALIGAAVTLIIALAAKMADGAALIGAPNSALAVLAAALLPLAPVAILGYGAVVASRQVLRSYYLRDLEMRIQDTVTNDALPRWVHLEVQTAGTQGPLSIRAIWIMFHMVLVFAILAVVGLAARTVTGNWSRLFVVAVNVGAGFPAVVVNARNAYRGYSVWQTASERTGDLLSMTRKRSMEPKAPPAAQLSTHRSLASYLAVPRVGDHVGKVLMEGVWNRPSFLVASPCSRVGCCGYL